MTAPRIGVSGKLMMDPQSMVLDGEIMAGAAMFVRVRASPMAGVVEGEAGPAVMFVTATGGAADALTAFRLGDLVRVSGAVRRARYQDNGGERECFACEGRFGRADGAALMGSGCDCARRLRGAEGP